MRSRRVLRRRATPSDKPVEFIWHDSDDLADVDAVILPGGFSYGDYLRCGAIAKFSPVMKARRKVRRQWRPGAGHLQWLPDSGRSRPAPRRADPQRRPAVHLPRRAPARRNNRLAVHVRRDAGPDAALPDRARRRLLLRRRPTRSTSSRAIDHVVFRYATPDGARSIRGNPNGSLRNIAGICNRERNVLGMMPHPERATDRSWTPPTAS